MSKRKKTEPHGHLFIIGGAEDRDEDKLVLSRFVELAGGPDARIAVLTAASSYHDEVWPIYDEARAQTLYDADAIFMTGGDQKRLVSLIGGTRIDRAMHLAVRERGVCLAGTSAGASAMSEHMLFDTQPKPTKGSVQIAAGLGFMRRVVIDQHFSERLRLSRLLNIVAQNPYLLGCGIDEDTALIVEPGMGLEVIGDGAVTILDGREMCSNIVDTERAERFELTNVKLHLMPAGARYYFDGTAQGPSVRTIDGRTVPVALYDVVAAVASSSEASLPTALAA